MRVSRSAFGFINFNFYPDLFIFFYSLIDNNRAVLSETLATGEYNNITLTGYDIFNFYSNQIVELVHLPDGEWIQGVDYPPPHLFIASLPIMWLHLAAGSRRVTRAV